MSNYYNTLLNDEMARKVLISQTSIAEKYHVPTIDGTNTTIHQLADFLAVNPKTVSDLFRANIDHWFQEDWDFRIVTGRALRKAGFEIGTHVNALTLLAPQAVLLLALYFAEKSTIAQEMALSMIVSAIKNAKPITVGIEDAQDKFSGQFGLRIAQAN